MPTTDTTPPSYPLPKPTSNDTRLTYRLLFDVADILDQHGYPRPAGTDWAHLLLALSRFLYQENNS